MPRKRQLLGFSMGSLGTTWKRRENGFLLSLMENIKMIYQENIMDICNAKP